MNINYTEIILPILGLIGSIITVVLVPYIKSKTTTEQQIELAKMVKIAVSAAEQIFSEIKQGKEKYEFVINWLKTQGFNLDNDKLLAQIEVLIEAFVSEINNANVKIDV